ncbi:MAG: DegT/DnrJ/EryC1/StrS family aminotransferase [Phycisphaerae bacterium]|nr:DegT/DnrJ/EryC1/StrS family aminotransferase [Phycisphaerae bacterium]
MSTTAKAKSELALLGGPKTIDFDPGDMFTWPIVTKEHEEAVLAMLRAGQMSNWDVTEQFEKAYAKALGRKYALACNNGTSAIQCALYGLGVGAGDEVICPGMTFWASIAQVYPLRATPVFAEIDRETLCIDPDDLERCITPRTKAVVVVHYAGYPADMDRIMAIAEKHNIKVMEDCSHSHGAMYKGRETGTIGHAAGLSCMSGKSFAIGEGGIMFTDDQRVYERALLLGHYERTGNIQLEDLKPYVGLPAGGYKFRIHQLSSAMGLVQLKHYPAQMAEIAKAMNLFCDLIEGLPGVKPVRPAKGSGLTKGGWYHPLAHYDAGQLEGLSIQRFCEALSAEGLGSHPGCNRPLHTHPLFVDMQVFGEGRPTRVANLPEGIDTSHLNRRLPIAEEINNRVFSIPWFKHHRPEVIGRYAQAVRKVVENHRDLLAGDQNRRTATGDFSTAFRR